MFVKFTLDLVFKNFDKCTIKTGLVWILVTFPKMLLLAKLIFLSKTFALSFLKLFLQIKRANFPFLEWQRIIFSVFLYKDVRLFLDHKKIVFTKSCRAERLRLFNVDGWLTIWSGLILVWTSTLERFLDNVVC